MIEFAGRVRKKTNRSSFSSDLAVKLRVRAKLAVHFKVIRKRPCVASALEKTIPICDRVTKSKTLGDSIAGDARDVSVVPRDL